MKIMARGLAGAALMAAILFTMVLPAFVPHSAYAGDNLCIFDGELVSSFTTTNCSYGSPDTADAFRGSICFRGSPDAWHKPAIKLNGLAAYRSDISGFDEVWFFAKCDQPGKTFDFSINGLSGSTSCTTPEVNIDPYITGGGLDTDYRLVRIPLSVLVDPLKNPPTYELKKIQTLYFGLAKPSSTGQKIYVDEVWAVKASSGVSADALPILATETFPEQDFGDVAIRTTVTMPGVITIDNTRGKGPLEVNRYTCTNADFAAEVPVTVPAGETRPLNIAFTPSCGGVQAGTLILHCDNTPMLSGTAITVPVRGEGAGPLCAVSGDELSFTTAVGCCIARKLPITNAGTTDLIVSAAATGLFTVEEACLPLVIPPGDSSEIPVLFNPVAVGTVAGTLTLTTNEAVGNGAVIALSGTGLDAGSVFQIPAEVKGMTSSTITVFVPPCYGKPVFYIGPEPAAVTDGRLSLQREIEPACDAEAGHYILTGLSAATDIFIHLEIRDFCYPDRVVARKNLYARTAGGPGAALDTPLRNVHLVAPNIVMLVLENKHVVSYGDGEDPYNYARLEGYTGRLWQDAAWTVRRNNGNPIAVTAVYRDSIPIGGDLSETPGAYTTDYYIVNVYHQIYLVLAENIGNNEILNVTGPQVSTAANPMTGPLEVTVPYSDYYLETPCIQVNQVGYSPKAHKRYAYVSGWLGADSAGTAQQLLLANFPAAAEVIVDSEDILTPRGAAMSGLPLYRRDVVDGDNTYNTGPENPDVDAGSEVREIDLKDLPAAEGVVYRVRIPGVGVSWPTQVSETAVFKAFYTIMRGIYFNRWGRDLKPECTEWLRDNPDHTADVYVGDYTSMAFVPSDAPRDGEARQISGGHHDAGDFDLQARHFMIPLLLMATYEANKEAFTDGQLNIPESNNGIPDILDEAYYNLKGFAQLQEADGGIRSGVESYRHPQFEDGYADEDSLPYWTYARHVQHTMRYAGLFAQLAYLTGDYSPGMAQEYAARAESAYAYARNACVDTYGTNKGGNIMLGSSQLYRLTGDYTTYGKDCEHAIETSITQNGSWRDWCGVSNYFGDSDGGEVGPGLAPFPECVMAYVLTPGVDTTTQNSDGWAIITSNRNSIIKKADDMALTGINAMTAHRPRRHNITTIGWGGGLTEQYMLNVYNALRIPLDPARKQSYIDAMSLAYDHEMGCNPLGMVWITGLGSRYPMDVLHTDSRCFTIDGKGEMPGLAISGVCSGVSAQPYGYSPKYTMYPAFESRAIGRRSMDYGPYGKLSEVITVLNAKHIIGIAPLIDPDLIPPDSWKPGGKEHRNTLAPRESIVTFTITASAGPGGTIAPQGAVTVNSGTEQTFTITPNIGYCIAELLVDGVSVDAAASYTFMNVTANHTITASFAVNTYTITASAGSGGTISPQGSVSVDHGAGRAFTITPNAGYVVDTVTVDGLSVGPVTAYTFTNVTQARTIAATFKALAVPPAAPTNLAVTAKTKNTISVKWTDNAANETGYEVEWSKSSSFSSKMTASLAANTTVHKITGLSAYTMYYIRVRAKNTAGYSAYSNIVSQRTNFF